MPSPTELRPHARHREAEVHIRERVGEEKVPGHDEAGGDGRAGKGRGTNRRGVRLGGGGAAAARVNLRKMLDATAGLLANHYPLRLALVAATARVKHVETPPALQNRLGHAPPHRISRLSVMTVRGSPCRSSEA